MKKLLLLALLAQTAAAEEAPSDGPPGPPSRWGLGVGAVASDSPYAGEGTRVMPVPLISYQGEKFFFQGIRAGWQFVRTDAFEFAAIAQFKFDGFDIKDLSRQQLAANGLDYRLLEDRDDSLDAGVTAKWSGMAGEIELELLTDVTDKSGGQQFSLQYGYPLHWGQTMVTPNVGVTWLSDDTANYYYGTLDKEVARGAIDYKPDAATIPHVGVNVMRSFGRNWSAFAFLKYSVLPDEIKDSPFLEPDSNGSASILIGVSRNF
ncbi:MipA/OmpV family protein [Steroidobacter flavus]|uniref:MipA/OmpV family protein n=1 Tax=Steroidobacter flavus TaxID=1842136 RepID=A0ABV8T4N3_9GAMM